MMTVAPPLVLGSRWAFIPAGVAICLIVVRTALEDGTLQNELDGYKEYAQRVRYRLLPGIWYPRLCTHQITVKRRDSAWQNKK
jgi:protein-S-isoprenylcysteine O-methyltransferase Ste14